MIQRAIHSLLILALFANQVVVCFAHTHGDTSAVPASTPHVHWGSTDHHHGSHDHCQHESNLRLADDGSGSLEYSVAVVKPAGPDHDSNAIYLDVDANQYSIPARVILEAPWNVIAYHAGFAELTLSATAHFKLDCGLESFFEPLRPIYLQTHALLI